MHTDTHPHTLMVLLWKRRPSIASGTRGGGRRQRLRYVADSSLAVLTTIQLYSMLSIADA
jgi:hypothetical protein